MSPFKDLYVNKKVVVTGAGKGIGRAVATELHRLGAQVYAVTRSGADLKSLVKECPNIKPIELDVSDWNVTKQVLLEALPDDVNVLINNAGVLDHQSHLSVTSDTMDRIMGVNVKAVVNITQICVSKMIASGTKGVIVNVSSDGSIRPDAEYPIYCASKCAIDSLTKTMAVEFGKHKIRVVSIHPGWVKTPMTAPVTPKTAEEEEQFMKSYGNRYPLGEFFVPVEQVVNTILFIGSDLVGMMTGSGVVIDGGYIAT